jgi:hypothetical protein
METDEGSCVLFKGSRRVFILPKGNETSSQKVGNIVKDTKDFVDVKYFVLLILVVIDRGGLLFHQW